MDKLIKFGTNNNFVRSYSKCRKGILATLFSVIGLICVGCFYYFQLNSAWLFFVGSIMFVIGVIFRVQSIKKREKGFWKYSPIIVFGIYVIGVSLSILLLVFMGESWTTPTFNKLDKEYWIMFFTKDDIGQTEQFIKAEIKGYWRKNAIKKHFKFL